MKKVSDMIGKFHDYQQSLFAVYSKNYPWLSMWVSKLKYPYILENSFFKHKLYFNKHMKYFSVRMNRYLGQEF